MSQVCNFSKAISFLILLTVANVSALTPQLLAPSLMAASAALLGGLGVYRLTSQRGTAAREPPLPPVRASCCVARRPQQPKPARVSSMPRSSTLRGHLRVASSSCRMPLLRVCQARAMVRQPASVACATTRGVSRAMRPLALARVRCA